MSALEHLDMMEGEAAEEGGGETEEPEPELLGLPLGEAVEEEEEEEPAAAGDGEGDAAVSEFTAKLNVSQAGGRCPCIVNLYHSF